MEKTEKETHKNILKIIVVFLNIPGMLLLNFKQIQQNLTIYHTLFLHKLCVHSV